MIIKESTFLKKEPGSLREMVISLENSVKELEEIRLKYECLFDRSIESIYIHDLNGRMLDLNKAGLDLVGYTKEEISGMNLSDFLNESQYKQAIALIEEVIIEGSPIYPVEYKIRRKDGSWLDVEVFPSPIIKNGKPVAIIGVCRDITDRKNYEEALQESEKNFRAIAENVGAGILVLTGEEGRLSYINKMFATISGYSLLELRNKTIRDLSPPDTIDILFTRHNAILKGGVFKKTIEAKLLRKEGSEIPVEISGARTYWKGEHADLVLINDISNRKKDIGSALMHNEELYKLALDAGKLRFWEWDSRTNEFYTPSGPPNPSEWGFKGRVEDLFKYIHPDDRGIINQTYAEIRNGRNQFSFKIRFFKDGNETIWGQIDGKVYRNRSGRPTKIVGIGKDITEQVVAETEKSEILLEKAEILDAMGEGLIVCDLNGKIIEANPAYLKLTGLKRDELIGMHAPDMISATVASEDAQRMLELYPEVVSGNKLPSFIINVIHKDGKKIPVHFVTSYLRDSKGEPKGVVSLIKDISYQKKTQEYLKLSHDELEHRLTDSNAELKDTVDMLDELIDRKTRLENLIRQQRDLAIRLSASTNYDDLIKETMHMAMSIPGIDCAGMYIIERKTGNLEIKAYKGLSEKFIKKVSVYSPDSPQMKLVMNGLPLYGFYPSFHLEANSIKIKEGLRGIAVLPAIYEGKLIAVLNIASRTLDEIPVYAREFFESIATQAGAALFRLWTEDELKIKQAELLNSEEKYRSLVESMNETFFMFDPNGIVTYLSQSGNRTFGYLRNEFIGRHFLDFMPLEDRDNLSRLFSEALAGKLDEGEYRVLDKRGNIRWVQASFKRSYINDRLAGIQGIISDVTHRRLLQQRLVLSERMAATGQLAASIAHEINSPLQAITITLSSMKKAAKNNPDLTVSIDLLRGAFENISATVKNLLDLNRPGIDETRPIDINDILSKTVALVKAQLRQNRIRVSMELGKNLPPINVSAKHVGQVLLNIINNAIDAINGEARSDQDYNHDIEGGVIMISTRMEKGMVNVKIEDSGSGIGENNIERIFTPFFTTKKGAGMGIGLSICRTIIEENGGTLTASNSPERKGAVFTLKFPPIKD
jgi:PAS domain S-box-containing protein